MDILDVLLKERARIDNAIRALEAGSTTSTRKTAKKGGRRKMSAAGRKKIAAAQKARWAAIRAAKK